MADSTTKTTGNWGEDRAAEYLQSQGYVLHHRNWRSAHREIDLVAEWHGEIIFVEVKTRSVESNNFRSALSVVDRHKRNLLILAARHYMNYFYSKQDRPYRFDIITIVGNRLSHYKRAFAPESYDSRYSRGMEQEW